MAQPKTTVNNITNALVAIGFIGIIGIMLGSVPPFILSMLLAVNITLALMVLMIALHMMNPLEFTSFPTVLLILTFFRLSLNVASTKLILTPQPGEGMGKAGAVIEFFGQVVAGGNPVIGAVVFLILIIIQFIVITKGSGRIAEVAARFTLDAMPGKQMAIDADLNAGLIDEAEARQRRNEIRQEADFYGAMDGASKFVRGDAIAGIIITIINIIGGIVVGMVVGELTFTNVLYAYTILTIGDGLASQIPALLTSIGAGVVVTRAGDDAAIGQTLTKQVFDKPEAMYVAAAALFLVASFGVVLQPGIIPPFLILACLLGGGGYYVSRTKTAEITRMEEEIEEEEAPPEPERVESLLEVDPMEIEIGFGLISIVDTEQGGDLLERVSVIRRQTAVELGILVPPIRIRDNMQLGPRQYNILIRGIKVAEGEIRPDRLLAMRPAGEEEEDDVPGIKTIEPAFGTPAKWIETDERSRAEMAGYSVVEPAAVLATHLTEIIRTHAAEILGRQETQQLVNHLRERNEALVNELIETMGIRLGTIQKVLQGLLRERVPIRNLELIFEAIADYAEAAQMNPDTLIEYCRMNLARIITNLYIDQSGQLPVITVDPNIESRIIEGMQRGGAAGIMATDPAYAERVIASIEAEVYSAMSSGYHPLILTTPQIRSHLRRLCERRIPQIIVLSYNEVAPEVPVTRVATVRLQNEGEKVSS